MLDRIKLQTSLIWPFSTFKGGSTDNGMENISLEVEQDLAWLSPSFMFIFFNFHRRQEEQKREKDAVKKAIKKERKQFRTVCKEANFYSVQEEERVRNMAEVDKLCEILSLCELEDLNKHLAADASSARSV